VTEDAPHTPAGSDSGCWYDEAEAYELAFGFDTTREVSMLGDILESVGVRPPARLLEPMVGGGRLIPGLSAAGFDVVGFDRAHPMLLRARDRNRGRLFRADAARFATAPVFDAAYCLIDSFRYLPTLADARRFLDSVAASLRPEAPFVLELDLVAKGPPVAETWSTTVGDHTAHASILSHGSAGEGLQWMDVTINIEGPDGHRTVRSRLPQRTWTPTALRAFLADHPGFRVHTVWRRSQESGAPLPGIPDNGGPVTILLRHTAHGTDRVSGPHPPSPGR